MENAYSLGYLVDSILSVEADMIDSAWKNEKRKGLNGAIDHIKTEIIRKAYQSLSAGKKKKVIRESQSLLIFEGERLLLALRYYSSPEVVSDQIDYVDFLEFVLGEVVGLLSYIEVNYADFFNPSLKFPDSCKYIYRKASSQVRAFVCRGIEEKLSDGELKVMLTEFVNCVDDENQHSIISYRDFIYYKQFIAELERLIRTWGAADTDRSLYERLIYMNFNEPGIFRHMTRRIKLQGEAAATFMDENMYLWGVKTLVAQVKDQSRYSYDTMSPGLKASLTKWIKEELSMLRENQRQYEKAVRMQNYRAMMPMRLVMNFNLKQLDFFTEILIEAKILLARKIKDVHEFIRNHIGTVNQEQLSLNSIRKKSHTATDQDKRFVRDELSRVVRLIEQKHL